jgi:hypothetical protein
LPSAHEDDELFEGDPDIGSATNPLQKLAMIASAYVNVIPILTKMLPAKTMDRYYKDYCPVLICLIHCHNKDLLQFLQRWGSNFRHSAFRNACCPGPRSKVVMANFPDLIPNNDGLYHFSKPLSIGLVDTVTVCLYFCVLLL